MGPYKSTWRRVIAGVPQGTKLGPLYFLVMVNDLTCEAPLYKYVDDCAVTETIKKCHLESSNLQCEIDYVNNWSIDNNLKINVKKTKEFHISTTHVPHSLPALVIGDETPEVVHTVKLLGVYLSSDLKWSIHINNVCFKGE